MRSKNTIKYSDDHQILTNNEEGLTLHINSYYDGKNNLYMWGIYVANKFWTIIKFMKISKGKVLISFSFISGHSLFLDGDLTYCSQDIRYIVACSRQYSEKVYKLLSVQKIILNLKHNLHSALYRML